MSRLARSVAKARRNDDAGFTLIELLIVIIILGVLAGVVVFSVAGITDRGGTSACRATVKTVEVASEAYYAKHSAYAGSVNALVADGLLKDTPATADGANLDYFVTYAAGTGVVSGDLHGRTSHDCK